MFIDDLYAAYGKWAELNGHPQIAKSTFGRNLRAVMPKLRVGQPGKGDNRRRAYLGLRLGPEADENLRPARTMRILAPTMTKCPCALCARAGSRLRRPGAHDARVRIHFVVPGFSLAVTPRSWSPHRTHACPTIVAPGFRLAGSSPELSLASPARSAAGSRPRTTTFSRNGTAASGGAPSRRPAETPEAAS